MDEIGKTRKNINTLSIAQSTGPETLTPLRRSFVFRQRFEIDRMPDTGLKGLRHIIAALPGKVYEVVMKKFVCCLDKYRITMIP